jgi:hypothetical protein
MTIALFTFLVALLAQVLGAFYNYQFLNVLDVPLNVHPLTLEDNILTALSHLPSFVATTIFPPVLGFAFKYHTTSQENLPSIKLDLTPSKFKYIKPIIFPLSSLILIISCLIFLPQRTSLYASTYIGLFFVLNVTFDKIKTYSFKEDTAFSLFCLLYLGFLIVFNLHKGEIDGYKFKSENDVKYILKVKEEQEEFISCSSLRFYSNDVLIVKNGKVIFIKNENVKEINIL